jgi:hypothetical protein
MSTYDLFVSYSHGDQAWVAELVARLRRAGLGVVRDELVIRPGDVLVHAVEQAIRDSAHGLLVFSPASVASPWVMQEYATLMQRSIERGQLFVPVLTGAILSDELPEFARSRYYADFRNASDARYAELVGNIASAVLHRRRDGISAVGQP